MAESFIKRLQPDPEGLDFEALRAEGIRLIQEVSGDIWTDYNLHDPGVTLLEAICYALTDLIHRTKFHAADYLTNPNGEIDFEYQGLYRPDQIFPSRPVTIDDYRALILSKIPKADNVWIGSGVSKSGGLSGLYRIYLLLSDRDPSQISENAKNEYIREVERIYSANRNLCEDLEGINIVERVYFSLGGEIEVEGKSDPADILAAVYFECSQYLSPQILTKPHFELYKEGVALDDLMSGTFTEHGYIDKEELHPWRGHFSIPDLIGRIEKIEGVRNVINLCFIDGEGKELDSIDMNGASLFHNVASLRFPPTEGELAITLTKSGKLYPLSLRDVEAGYNHLEFKYQALRQQKASFDWINANLPDAVFRNRRDYFSLQNHLPDIYGLNAYGVSDSASPDRKAQALQLKAYLLFFEQIMANFLQNIQDIPALFSLSDQVSKSYSFQVLHSDSVPNVDEVYINGAGQYESELSGLVDAFDNFGDRRNRVLDYFLAIYGEEFGQSALHQFYQDDASFNEAQIKSKILFLKNIVDVNKNRGGASNYRDISNGNKELSGFHLKLRILLGLDSSPGPVHSDALNCSSNGNNDILIIEHILLRPIGEAAFGDGMSSDFYNSRMSVIFTYGQVRFDDSGFRVLAQEVINTICPAHICPDIFWLDAEQSVRFNAIHSSWLATLSSDFDQMSGTVQANNLIHFLTERRIANR